MVGSDDDGEKSDVSTVINHLLVTEGEGAEVLPVG